MELDSDRELWSRSLAGSGDAFAILFSRHERRVYRAVLRSADDSSAAEDLVATVFLELWRRRDSVRIVNDSLVPWLLVTATNVTRNANRSLRRYRAFLSKLPEPAQSQPIDSRAADRDVAQALRGMPRHDAEILALVAIDGLPLADAAVVLGLTPQTARARLSRARRRLRDDLPAVLRVSPHDGSTS
ncbi:MAG: sigma-70 family RNA polymerase sigma factor [Pseudolysinimonas sp.]